MEMFRRLWGYVVSTWGNLTTPYRVAVGSLVVTLVVLFAVGLSNVSTNGWVKLVGKDDPDLAAEVKEKLDGMKELYEIRDDGIYVKGERRNELLMDIASLGGDGRLYDFLKESAVFITQYQLQEKMLIAHQQKLQRMIMALDLIKAVRVKITPQSKQRKLGFQGSPATASVVVQLKPGKEFTMHNTVAISSIVAASVEGMKPEDVSIVDTTGRLYQVPPSGSAWQVAVTRTQAEREVEERLRNNVLALWPTAQVAVRVKLSSKTEDSRRRDLDEAGREREKEKKELSRNTKTPALTLPLKLEGSYDINQTPGTVDSESTEEAESRSRTDYGETFTDVHTPPGELLDATISVVYRVQMKEKETEEQAMQRAQASESERVKLIEGATGIEQNKIAVAFTPIPVPREFEGPTFVERLSGILSEYGGTIFLTVIAVAALVVLYLIIKRAMPKDVMDEIAAMRRRLEGEALSPEPEVAVAEQELTRMRMTIKELVAKNPRGVANVVRRWLTGKS